jgi:hypothetical protein
MKRVLRTLLRLGAGAAAIVLIVAAIVLGPFLLRVKHFRADRMAGYHADFYVYASPGAKQGARAGRKAVLLVQPNNSGTSSDNPGVHRRDAWWTTFGRHGLADELGVVLLVPAFVRPGEDWRIYTHALDRDALTTPRPDLLRIDLQLLRMVEQARAALEAGGVATEEKFLIQGYSASGMFANRFAALHPDQLLAVAAGSPGGWPIAPVAQVNGELLPYPAGIGDLRELIGAPFDSATFAALPQLIVMGSRDDNDSVDFRDGWDEEGAAQLDRLFGTDPLARWDDAQALYRSVGANATFLLVDGVGHDRRQLQIHTTRFFARLLAQRDSAMRHSR